MALCTLQLLRRNCWEKLILLYRSFYENKDWFYLSKNHMKGEKAQDLWACEKEYCVSMPLESDKRCF